MLEHRQHDDKNNIFKTESAKCHMLFQNDCLRSSYMCWRVFCVKPCIYDIHVCTLARVSLEFYYFINVIKCSKTAESLVLEDSGTISRKCSNINSRCTVALSTHNTHTKKTHTVMRGKHHGIKHSQTQKRKKNIIRYLPLFTWRASSFYSAFWCLLPCCATKRREPG